MSFKNKFPRIAQVIAKVPNKKTMLNVYENFLRIRPCNLYSYGQYKKDAYQNSHDS